MTDSTTLEEWRIVVEFPDYEVSNLGQVRRLTTAYFAPKGHKRIRSPAGYVLNHMLMRGYPYVCFRRDGKAKHQRIHVLVCKLFHGPRPTPAHEVAHWDGNKLNVRWDNLRWATPPENQADKIRHGRSARGAKNPNNKLRDADVANIRTMIANGRKQREIAAIYGIRQTTISRIKNKYTWAWLP